MESCIPGGLGLCGGHIEDSPANTINEDKGRGMERQRERFCDKERGGEREKKKKNEGWREIHRRSHLEKNSQGCPTFAAHVLECCTIRWSRIQSSIDGSMKTSQF